MPMHSDLQYVDDFAKYLRLKATRRESPSMGEYRDIMLLGWRTDFEKPFMDDMSYSSTDLPNLLVGCIG